MANNNDITRIAILQRWINEKGLVNYESLKGDKWVEEQLKRLKNIDISKLNSKAQLAFYLNAYNILTLKNVLIELEKNPKWKGNTPYLSKIRFFYLRKFELVGKKINLYNLENKILRKRFKDPRIHFAINCASKSCPVLPNRLFEPKTIEGYLDTLTRNFVNNREHVFFDEKDKVLYLNPIFKWYKKDFEEKGGVKKFITEYSEPAMFIADDVKIKYKKYDWELNYQ